MDGTMLNDRSSLLSLLETRRSAKPRDLVAPGPTPEEMERILTIAARIPDHGKLGPWRFVTVAEYQRDDLAILFRHALPAAANPLISLLGLSVAALLSASLVVETIMSWPGLAVGSKSPIMQPAVFES